MKKILALLSLAAILPAQPPTTSWPIYHGDYSGRRFSPLTAVNEKSIANLASAWTFRTGVQGSVKSTPLMVDGILYLTMPDHVWAVDARSGKELWHKQFPTKGGWHIGNRGVAISGNWLYVLTPDCQIISLNAKDGSERWHKQNCDLDQFYYGSMAPIIVKNKVIAGVSGDDLDRPGYLTAYDPENGDQKWRWSVVPMKKGDVGADTWPNEEAMRHGGGMTWQMPTYDPQLNLIYVTTGNAQPVIAHANRKGDNLFTGCVVALDADTGKMVWYFQVSPHDTHDWDSTQVPVLIDGEIDGKPRKLLAIAARNGYFFVLDRTNGKNIITAPYTNPNWAKGIRPSGTPESDPAKQPQIDGELSTPDQGGATNWPPPTFSPQTGLFYVGAARAFSVYYIFDPDLANPQGWGGTDRGGANVSSSVDAIDYKTGKIRWSHKWETPSSRSGLLSTAGNLVFTGDNSSNFEALNATTGDPVWHSKLTAPVSNGPISYELDGRQYVVVAAGDTLWSFAIKK